MNGYTQNIFKIHHRKLVQARKVFLFGLLQLFFINNCIAQKSNVNDSLKPKVIFSGLLQARYLVGLTKNVDIKGVHHPSGNGVSNNFDIRRARAQVNVRVSDRAEAVFLVNLADFKSDPKNKVLENAYLTYRLNSFVNFKMGQFRPAFGLEDKISAGNLKSFDFSNQYYAFGSNGWQSFQIGFGVFGAIAGKIPVRYELDVVNGNNKNQASDDDDGKQAMIRLQVEPLKKIKVGINGGFGFHNKEKVYAAGIDLASVFQLKNKWSLEFDAEYKKGNNHTLFFSQSPALRTGNINEYQISGYYLLPTLRYAISYHSLTSIELSCRYEYLNTDTAHQSNPRQTITPMISFEFLKSYNGRIQFGVVSDWYKRNIIATSIYKNNLFILQLQTKL